MPVNPHIKGGPDVPIVDGGTGASTASGARTNLDALNEAAHDLLDHNGLMGVGDLTTMAHSMLDHAMIPGSGANGGLGSVISATGGTIVVPADTLQTPGSYIQVTVIGVEAVGSNGGGSVTIGGATVAQWSFGNAQSGNWAFDLKLFYVNPSVTSRQVNVSDDSAVVPSWASVASTGIACNWTIANNLSFNITAADPGETVLLFAAYAHK